MLSAFAPGRNPPARWQATHRHHVWLLLPAHAGSATANGPHSDSDYSIGLRLLCRSPATLPRARRSPATLSRRLAPGSPSARRRAPRRCSTRAGRGLRLRDAHRLGARPGRVHGLPAGGAHDALHRQPRDGRAGAQPDVVLEGQARRAPSPLTRAGRRRPPEPVLCVFWLRPVGHAARCPLNTLACCLAL